MSDIDSNEHEEIARRLREDGPVQAPSDLAGEVMKRVRTEPRRSTSAVRRPLVTLLAAALVTAALVAGIAKLGGGSASSAGSVGAGGGGSEAHGPSSEKAAQPLVVQSKVVDGVPRSALKNLRTPGAVLSSADSPNLRCYAPTDAFSAARAITLEVPFADWYPVQLQLRTARQAATAATPGITVHLRRLAPGSTAADALTCP
jgi:hypothetical protein